ncbi:MAG: DUF374 domain-containing protein [Chlorobiaceae bacterium]|nr:DUF374 domain-containing protein [Chlorobiaceae bacterium]
MQEAAKKQLKKFRPENLERPRGTAHSLVNTTLRNIAPALIAPLLRSLFSSQRIELRMPGEGLPDRRRGVVFAFWHGKMATGWLLARRLFPNASHAAVVSLSKDGQLLSDTLGRLGFRLIRGSSSKGKEAVRSGIADALRSGEVVAVTPDGPRGPINRFKYGTLRLASETGSPVLFADIAHDRPRILKSWDRFEIPRPFGRAVITLHLVDVPRFDSEEELQRFANSLSERFAHA